MDAYMQVFRMNEHELEAFVSDNMYFPAHWHIQCEILYVLAGEITAGVNQRTYQLHKGDMVVAGSNDIHYYHSHNSRTLLCIFHPEILGQRSGWPHDASFLQPCIRAEQITVSERETMLKLLEYKSLHTFMLRGYINLLCGSLEKKLRPAESLISGESRKPIAAALDYIERNYSSEIDLQMIADNINLSKYHFSRKFKNYTGMSIPQYINLMRLHKAEKALITTDKSIATIAFECGFASLRNFNRAFQQKNRITPSAMRKAHCEIEK